MKRFFIVSACIFAAAAMLTGCAKKTGWVSLWSTPIPGRTSSIIATPKPTPTPDPNLTKLFTTDVATMADPSVIVYKTKHTLEVWDGKKLMARMQVALGRGEGGPKLKDGDNNTPEGKYYVCKTAEGGKFHRSLFISYPNTEDGNAGLLAGLIKQSDLDKINTAIENKTQPPWDTKLGGEIAINGIGSGGAGKTGDWTAGNIAIADKDMDYLWKFIKVGMDVEIDH